jgi:c-di-GMP-binding flagellar brake protein YcgR
MSEMTESEARLAPRKKLCCSAKVAAENRAPLKGQAIDISLNGISVLVAEPIPFGLSCSVAFEVAIDGEIKQVSAIARSVYSVAKGTEGFRIGLQFFYLDESKAALINQLPV